MSDFIAKRVEAGVPIWNLFFKGVDIGCYTEFAGGPMATVVLDGIPKTVSGRTRALCLSIAKGVYVSWVQDCRPEVDEVALENEARIRQAAIDSEDYAMRYESYQFAIDFRLCHSGGTGTLPINLGIRK